MTLDADDHFGSVRLPSGSGWEIARLGANPTLLLGSDFPVAMGRDGNLYYPSHGGGGPLQILKFLPSGQSSVLATLPATTAGGPFRDLNGLAAGPDGSLYYTENDAIRRISSEGRVSTVAPLLRGLDLDAGGAFYVAATGCGSVLKITPTGQVTVLPKGPSPWAPTGVALFGDDLYVLEFQNPESDDRREMLPRVRKIAPDGKTSVIATVTRR
jgi:DNA-binding beta-propeller fold protein YncE